ncbi:hypothetical protein P9112_008733 [Eukaryota sp. TZLM1-RC]
METKKQSKLPLFIRFLLAEFVSVPKHNVILAFIIVILGSVGSVIGFLFQFKPLIFTFFILGVIFFSIYFLFPSMMKNDIDDLLSSNGKTYFMLHLIGSLFALFTLGNLIWFALWICSFTVWSFTFHYDFTEPEGSDSEGMPFICLNEHKNPTCHFYYDVPYGQFDSFFFFNLLLFIAGWGGVLIFALCLFASPPVAIVEFVTIHLSKTRAQMVDSDTNTLFLRLSVCSFLICSVPWLFAHSFAVWGKDILFWFRVSLGLIGLIVSFLVAPSLSLLFSESLYTELQLKLTKINYIYSGFLYFVICLPYCLSFIGLGASLLYFFLVPDSKYFLFIKSSDTVSDSLPSLGNLLLSFLNILVIVLFVLLVGVLCWSVRRCYHSCSNRFHAYEARISQQSEDVVYV